jgi:sulfur-carrier protein adenylyltransferase/sulfurtransferase
MIENMDTLTRAHQERYARQLGLPDFGEEGQRRLAAGRVLVVGAGGLGSPVIYYLAGAGVGTLGVADGDTVQLSNLPRQILHDTPGVGRPKSTSAAERVSALNPDVTVVRFAQRLTPGNVDAAVRAFDVVVDCTDNFHTRYLLNDACVLAGKPMAHGAVYAFEGQASTFIPGQGPCYRCLFPEPPAEQDSPPVFGPAPGLIGIIQAAETLKLLLGIGVSLMGRLLLCDTLKMRFKELTVRRSAECPVCGDAPRITSIDPDAPDYSPQEKTGDQP